MSVLGDTLTTGAKIMYRNPTPIMYHNHTKGDGAVLLNVVNCTDFNGPGPWLSLQLHSTNDGLTWSSSKPAVGLAGGDYDGVLAGPGFGIQLGRHSETNRRDPILSNRVLYCGATGYHKGHAMNAVVWYSDTGGARWQVSSTVFKEMGECQMVELANGSITIKFRNGDQVPPNACRCYASSISHNGGRTWRLPVSYDPQLIEQGTAFGLLNNGQGGGDSLYFSNPADPTPGRDRMTVRRSGNSGLSWDKSLLVWNASAGYSVLTPVNDTHIGLVFENGGDTAPGYAERISFVAVPNTLER